MEEHRIYQRSAIEDAPIYYLVTVNKRGQVTESAWSTERESVAAKQERTLAAHPDWSCRIKVWR